MPVLLFQNIAASLVLLYGKQGWRIPLKILMLAMVVVEIIDLTLDADLIKPAFALTYIIYFSFLSTELFRQIWKTKGITLEMFSAVLCGFIMLGLSGSDYQDRSSLHLLKCFNSDRSPTSTKEH